MRPPSAEHWFGFDKQGCDVYARVIYGARSSVLVGDLLDAPHRASSRSSSAWLAGFYGGWIDAILARFIDIVLGIPPLLGAIVVAKALADQDLGIWPVVLALGLLGWPSTGARGPVVGHRRQASGLRQRGARARRRQRCASCSGTSCRTRSRRLVVVLTIIARGVHRVRGHAVVPRRRAHATRSRGASTSPKRSAGFARRRSR